MGVHAGEGLGTYKDMLDHAKALHLFMQGRMSSEERGGDASVYSLSVRDNVTIVRESTCKSCGRDFDSSRMPKSFRECPHCGTSWGSKSQ
ncbi:MAG: hypothetical protein MPJ05_06490 [Nitrosopumilus sp.]|nr:hypothetical protein [Nitrosopumilus sp.]MDA7998219.1 hypothetical protein [Nitrosopumilus sp.]CAI9832440.1 hypothetical protein IBTHAUMO2_780011 [Nitrosopumilaceae archaeon]